ncbi:MAG TPA: NADP-specific glutamate dehydrogenase [Natronosporangium sp.]|nr:NADP-specific glutamate dehydrogenase [Natronosporangium sp.]
MRVGILDSAPAARSASGPALLGDGDHTRDVDRFMREVIARNPGEPEFHQVVREMAESVVPYLAGRPDLRRARLLERLTEPDRIVTFPVVWTDDRGDVRINRAWRVQFNNALGPYKGGLRFHPTVNQSVLKGLAFEQVFKNALTGLPMGGAKGGSDFDPKAHSEREVMRFCQALMVELHRHIGEHTDVPAGDIGVGSREIGYLYGAYKRLENRVTGVLTGKGVAFGGSLIRAEATGYGCVYFCEHVLNRRGDSVAGKRVVVSGSGNVAIHAAEKAVEMGATVLTLSDSDGFVHDPAGIDAEKLAFVKELKNGRRGRIREYAERFPGATYHHGQRPWRVPAEVVLPCATENELGADDVATLLSGGVQLVAEGANMALTLDAVAALREAKVLYAPGKAANAGGVAVSGLEQTQNAMRLAWSAEEVDQRLRAIMRQIHDECVTYGERNGAVDYLHGANLAGFIRVAEAVLAHGVW